MAVDFFKKFVDDLGDPDTSIADEGKASSEFTGYLDTGSYILNAAISGSLFRGLPNNKAILFAGDPATGKTFFAMALAKAFQDIDPKARVFYTDTESAVTNQMMASRGLDLKRVIKSEPETLERFRNNAVKLLDNYAKIPKEDRFPLMIVLDSLSQLPSAKEVADVTEEKDTRDMTKPGVIKGMFRMLRLKAAKVNVPIVITNHTYAQIGAYVPTKVVAGGTGAQYAADTIVMLSKKQDKQGDTVVGNIIHVHMKKSRLSRENTKVDTRILFNGGLDRYYGLLEYAEAAGIIKKVGNRWEFPDGTKAFEKAIAATPEQFWTPAVLQTLDSYITSKFMYTDGSEPDAESGDDDE